MGFPFSHKLMIDKGTGYPAMKLTTPLMIIFISIAAAAPAFCAESESAGKQTAAVLNFYLLSRIPRGALNDTVVLSGDSYFSAERYGLENTLRRLFSEVLRTGSAYKIKPASPPSIPDDTIEAPFIYWAKSDNPADFFDKNKIGEQAKSLGVDYLIVGLIQNLEIAKSSKGLADESVKMKVSTLVFETATGTFIQSKTYEGESKKVNGLPDFDLLPKKSGKVPYDIMKFAESETGRVFLDMLPQMIADIPGGEKIKPILSGNYTVAGGQKLNKAHVVSGSSPEPSGERAKEGPECGDPSLAVLTAAAGKNTGVRIYSCSNGVYDFDSPSSETKSFASTKKGIGSLTAGDFDGDGTDELAATPLDAGEFVKLYKFQGGGFDPAQPWQAMNDIMPGVNLGLRAAAGDFDGDGKDELALTADRGGDFTIFLKYSQDHFEAMAPETQLFNVFGTSKYGAYIAAGDFDGDGKDDVALASAGGGEMIKVFSFAGGENVRPKLIGSLEHYFNDTAGSTSLATGDFDGDGKADLAAASVDGGVSIKVYRYRDGKFDKDDPLANVSADWDNRYKGARVDAGDFDGDGKADLAVSTTGGDGYLWIFKYAKGRFLLSKPYLDSADIYDNAPFGIIATVGKFNK
jgi:hypothetical protein